MSAAARVSVIVPAYNYAHFLDACLASVTQQAQADLEVLVIDDGSTDGTAEVVRRHAGVTYIHQANQGLSAARNTGIRASSGDYLLFLDADDLLAPRSLAARVEFLRARPHCAVAVCRNRLFQAGDGALARRFGAAWHLAPSALDTRLCHFNIAPPHAFLLRRRVIDEVGLFDTGLRACEDYDYWLRALAAGHVPLYSPAGQVYYRKHAASMSADNANQLHHDVVLHGRVFAWLLERDGLQRVDALSALLAAYAGVFTTLTRLPDPGHADHVALLGLLDRALPLCAAVTLPSRHHPLVDYYLLLLLARLDELAAAEAAAARGADLLDQLARCCGLAVLQPRAYAAQALRAAVTAADAAFIDRWRVGKLVATRFMPDRAGARQSRHRH